MQESAPQCHLSASSLCSAFNYVLSTISCWSYIFIPSCISHVWHHSSALKKFGHLGQICQCMSFHQGITLLMWVRYKYIKTFGQKFFFLKISEYKIRVRYLEGCWISIMTKNKQLDWLLSTHGFNLSCLCTLFTFLPSLPLPALHP